MSLYMFLNYNYCAMDTFTLMRSLLRYALASS